MTKTKKNSKIKELKLIEILFMYFVRDYGIKTKRLITSPIKILIASNPFKLLFQLLLAVSLATASPAERR